MSNAKRDFLQEIKGNPRVRCAYVVKRNWDDKPLREGVLKVNYSEEDYIKFLEDIDFNFDSGFGGQMVFGNIWYEDGTWSQRGEYDGSEWWEYMKMPEINKELL